MLTEYVRAKQRLTIETAVRMLACETAEAVGLYDRGLVKPGFTPMHRALPAICQQMAAA